MRRKDKEISDRLEIEDIIYKADVCRLAMVDGNMPYLVPMCFGYKDNCLYFHSAKEGRKVEILKRNNNVCFEFEYGVTIHKKGHACDWGMIFKSVIGTGKVSFLDKEAEKKEAMHLILAQYDDARADLSGANLKSIAVMKVEIEEMTGKVSPAPEIPV